MASARFKFFLLAIATIALGLGVRQVLSGPPAKYLGVALYAVMVVFVVKVVRPALSDAATCVVALAICFAIEAFQLTSVPARVNAQVPFLRLVLGEVFSWWDLPTYAAGVAIASFILRRVP